jgi:hypothetical protein
VFVQGLVALSGYFGGHGIQVGVERDLGVDWDAPATRQVNDQIGSRGLLVIVAGQVALGVEVEVLGETRGLDDLAERRLAPLGSYAACTSPEQSNPAVLSPPQRYGTPMCERANATTAAAVALGAASVPRPACRPASR